MTKINKKYLFGKTLLVAIVFTLNFVIAGQVKAATKVIRDDSTGGDCGEVGIWEASSKTCYLNSDTSETIYMNSESISIDGNGHEIIGTGGTLGLYVMQKNVSVRNLKISGFQYGIIAAYADNLEMSSIETRENSINGIMFYKTKNAKLSNIKVLENGDDGIYFYYSGENFINSSHIESNGGSGAYRYRSGGNNFEGNNVSGNTKDGFGMKYSTKSVMRNNFVNNNSEIGIKIGGADNILEGNIMYGNEKGNLKIEDSMDSNVIDTNNLSEGKPVYYLVNESDGDFDGSVDDIGEFYCIRCNNVSVKNLDITRNGSRLYFWKTDYSHIEGIDSFGNSGGVALYESDRNTLTKNNFQDLGLTRSVRNKIYSNNFLDESAPVKGYSYYLNLFNLDPPVGGNYWRVNEGNCEDSDNNGFCDRSYLVYERENEIDYYPLKEKVNLDKPEGYSSVAFLPGIQSSRLYKNGFWGEDRLWEPTNRNEDVKDLYLNSDGTSIDENIYTRDIADSIYGFSIYRDFMGFMDELVSDGTIKDWKAMPYDWRMPLGKIVNDGIKLENDQEYYLVDEIRKLAQDSDTGKVTIIGHSNGGLVGKELISKLKETGEEGLIDKFIIVATPQLGTPKAIVGLLHGDGLNLAGGLLVDRKTGRGLAENMSSAYNLLPSEKYFDYVETPVVEFDEDVSEVYDFRKIYRENIDNYGEFEKFLRGDDGERSDPRFSDTDSPNVLSQDLLLRSRSSHRELDNWEAPEGMEVVQLAGWGLDTIAGIKYDDCDIPFCPDKLSNLGRELVFKEDGDKTVVIPSAISADGAERYYVNLKKYNNTDQENKEHANIVGVKSVQDFILNIIQGNRDLPEYVLVQTPVSENEDKRLRYRMHSPVKVDLYDNEGNHTGIIENRNPESDLILYEEEIPNSYYLEFGETKYLGSDGGFPISVDLVGEDLGTFTFEVDEIYGGGEVETTIFEDIPVMEGMRANLEIVESVGIMEMDIDGDGEVDFEIESGSNQNEIMRSDILEKILINLEIHKATKDRLVNKLDNAKKQIKKKNIESASAMLESLAHQTLVFSREKTVEKFRIPENDAKKIIEIIETIKNNLIR